ncbi:MAG: WG repeat-containing protein [Bacteroidota bacterium]|nr:WG repeat-containing protein [Bacteroidota bacterium]
MSSFQLKKLLFFSLIFSCSLLFGQTLDNHLPLPVKMNGKWGMINMKGELILPAKYDKIETFEKWYGVAKVQSKDKVGLINIELKEIIPPEYKNIKFINESYFLLENEEHSFLYIRSESKLVKLNHSYDKLYFKGFYFISVSDSSYYGIIDTLGNELIAPVFELIERTKYCFIVEKNNLKGLYLKDGKQILEPVFSEIRVCTAKNYLISKDDRWGLIDLKGNKLLETEWTYFFRSSDLLFMQHEEGYWIIYNLSKHQIVLKLKYDFIDYLSDDFVAVSKGNKTGVIKMDGTLLIEPLFDLIEFDRAGFFWISKKNKKGICNSSGKTIIEPEFDEIIVYKNNVFKLFKNKKVVGLANFKGTKIFPRNVKEIQIYSDIAKIYTETSLILVELGENGDFESETEMKNVNTITVGNITLQKELSGRAVSPPEQEGWFYNAFLKKWGLKDTLGNVVLSPQFDDILIIEDLNLTVVSVQGMRGMNSQKIKTYMEPFSNYELKGIVDHKNYRIIVKPLLYRIFLDDLRENGRYMKCIRPGKNNFSLLDIKTGLFFHESNYIGKMNQGLAKFIIKGDINRSSKAGREVFKNDYTDFNLASKGGKWGFMQLNDKKPLIPAIYDFVEDFVNGTAIVKKDNFFGVIDTLNTTIIDFKYNNISRTSDSTLFLMEKANPLYGIIDSLGEVIYKSTFQQVHPFNEELSLVMVDKVYGYINKKGNIIIEPQYNKASSFSEEVAVVRTKRRWGVIDKTGVFIIEPQYSKLGDFKEGLAFVLDNGKYGYIDLNNEMVIPAIFQYAESFNNGVAIVRFENKYGLINKAGENVLKFKFKNITVEGNFIYAKKNKKYALYGTNGEKIIKNKYKEIHPFSDGLARMLNKKRYFFIDTLGKKVITCKYSLVENFQEGFAAVKINGKWGYINKNNKIQIEPQFNSAEQFVNGRAIVKLKNHYGLIDTTGKYILDASYDIINPFGENKTLVKKGNLYYFMDRDGQPVFDNYFHNATSFQGLYTTVANFYGWGLMDENGILQTSYNYAKLIPINDGYFSYSLNSTQGIMDLKGNEVLPMEYERIQMISKNIFLIEENNRIGYLKTDGQWLWELQK